MSKQIFIARRKNKVIEKSKSLNNKTKEINTTDQREKAVFIVSLPKHRRHRELMPRLNLQTTSDSDKSSKNQKLSVQIKQRLHGFRGVGEKDDNIRSFNSRNSGKK